MPSTLRSGRDVPHRHLPPGPGTTGTEGDGLTDRERYGDRYLNERDRADAATSAPDLPVLNP
ncbi:hypothetical protein [Streptomyces sp.]|uniref:hypothetical protein n=1 Tax=Streptomyces sp. TaxID=1931 RepID=UPI002811235A|nr:hypothetical protein [Streptomyces sp.]